MAAHSPAPGLRYLSSPAAVSRSAAATLWAWLPFLAAVTGILISLPSRLAFRYFLTADTGSNLSATMLARMGERPNLDFSFPFGPLTLAFQSWTLGLIHSGPWAMAALTMVGTLGFGWGASWAIRRLDLARGAAALLTGATAMVAVANLFEPVYALETAVLMWAIVSLAAGERARALSFCVAAALLKPTMGVVLGALVLGEAVWTLRRRAAAWNFWAMPAITAGALIAALMLRWGPSGFWRLALPLAGARTYRALHHSFFSVSDNPFLVAGANLHYYLGQMAGVWGLAWLLLPVALALAAKAAPGAAARRYAAAYCWLGTLAFVTGFYSWINSYYYYVTLPIVGLALLPWPALSKRWYQTALLLLAGLVFLSTFSDVRGEIGLWRVGHRAAATAGLWATPAEAAEWDRFTQRAPLGSPTLFVIGDGAPEAIFPQYRPPWHGFLFPGEMTAVEQAAAVARARAAHCVAFGHNPILPAATLSAMVAAFHHLPRRPGVMFDVYGCS